MSVEILKVIELIAPGLLAVILFYILNRKKFPELSIITIYSVILTGVIAKLAAWLASVLGINTSTLAYSLAILFTFVLILCEKLDFPWFLLRRLQITETTVHATVWDSAFSESSAYIVLNFKDGRRVAGTPGSVSGEDDARQVYLENCFDINRNEIIENTRGILFFDLSEIAYIEFLESEAMLISSLSEGEEG